MNAYCLQDFFFVVVLRDENFTILAVTIVCVPFSAFYPFVNEKFYCIPFSTPPMIDSCIDPTPKVHATIQLNETAGVRHCFDWAIKTVPRSLNIEKPSWQCEPSFDRIHPLFQTICRTKPNKSHRKCVSWLSTANACDRVLEQSFLLQLTNY